MEEYPDPFINRLLEAIAPICTDADIGNVVVARCSVDHPTRISRVFVAAVDESYDDGDLHAAMHVFHHVLSVTSSLREQHASAAADSLVAEIEQFLGEPRPQPGAGTAPDLANPDYLADPDPKETQ